MWSLTRRKILIQYDTNAKIGALLGTTKVQREELPVAVSCVRVAHVFQRISFLSFVVVVLFFVEADNMHDHVSIYFALIYRRREPVLVIKRVKSQAMFPPSWKFEKPNSITPHFFSCFSRGHRFRGGLRFHVFFFEEGLRFRGGSSFSRGVSVFGVFVFEDGLRFRGLRFRGLRFRGGLYFRGLDYEMFGLIIFGR